MRDAAKNPTLPGRLRFALAVVSVALGGGPQPAQAAPGTQTTLALTANGTLATAVPAATMVTLTASVQSGGEALHEGLVNFCDAAAPSCSDIHLLGSAQLTTAGTAMLQLRPAPGSHSYKATFLGTPAAATSSSPAMPLAVGARPPGLQTTFTVASISGPVASDTFNTYTLTAEVGTKGAAAPSGDVSFMYANINTGIPTPLPNAATLAAVNGGSGFLNLRLQGMNGGSADAPPIVTVGDFNGDGIPDIVSAPKGGIAISLGKGDGTFADPLVPDVDTQDGIFAFAVGDFNGDGKLDLLVDDEDTAELTMLLGQGDGTFSVGPSIHQPATTIAVADFNQDGNLDVALSGIGQTGVLLGKGDGSFTAAATPPQNNYTQLLSADFNGDGKTDLAAIDSASGELNILLGQGDGTFNAAANPEAPSLSRAIAADFNHDGWMDLAAIDATGASLNILIGKGDGTFAAPATMTLDANLTALALTVGDFNGDGKVDVAIASSARNPSASSAALSIFPGRDDGTFAASSQVAFEAGAIDLTSLAAADFAASGDSDLVTFGSVFLSNLAIAAANADNVLPTGGNIIKANYPGDASNAPSSSMNAPEILVPPAPFSLTSDPITLSPGSQATGSFTITSTTFTGTLNLSCSIAAAQGQPNPPTCTVPATTSFTGSGAFPQFYSVTAQPSTPGGAYTLTITASDPNTQASAAASAAVSVNPQNFELNSTATDIPSPGANGTSTITISPVGAYSGVLTLSCALDSGPEGAVDLPTCSIPSPITVAGAVVSTTLTLSTKTTTTPGVYSARVLASSPGSLDAVTTLIFSVHAPPPSFTLSNTAVSIASPGLQGTSTITITPSGGFLGSVALSCAVSGGPQGAAHAPTCSVMNPPPITGAAAVTATLTVNTTAASAARQNSIATGLPGSPFHAGSAGLVLAITTLPIFGICGRRRKEWRYLALLLIAVSGAVLAGCAGKPMPPSHMPPPANPGTPPGAYAVTVTGTGGAITATTTVPVTLQ